MASLRRSYAQTSQSSRTSMEVGVSNGGHPKKEGGRMAPSPTISTITKPIAIVLFLASAWCVAMVGNFFVRQPPADCAPGAASWMPPPGSVGGGSGSGRQSALPPWAIAEQMRRKNCTMEAFRQQKEMQEGWRQQRVPLLLTAILAPHNKSSAPDKDLHYHVFFNYRYMVENEKKYWSNHTKKRVEWFCDDERAESLGRVGGDPGRTGVTLVVRCPQRIDPHSAVAQIRAVHVKEWQDTTKIKRFTVPEEKKMDKEGIITPTYVDFITKASYNVALPVQCLHTEEEYIPPDPPKYVACPIIWGDDAHIRLKQWIAYHKLLGFQHFFVYLHEPWNASRSHLLPSAPYITYRPYDIDGVEEKKGGGATPKNFYQPPQQTECIYRSRNWGLRDSIEWAAIMDIDEYFQVLKKQPAKGPGSRPEAPPIAWVLDPLRQDALEGKFSSVMAKNWFWGAPRNDGLYGNDTDAPPEVDHEWLLDYTHRAPNNTAWGREKNIVVPWNVHYYSMHNVNDGDPGLNGGRPYYGFRHLIQDAHKVLRMSHFKEPSRGVFDYRTTPELTKKVVEDTSLRDAYKKGVLKIVQQEYQYFG